MFKFQRMIFCLSFLVSFSASAAPNISYTISDLFCSELTSCEDGNIERKKATICSESYNHSLLRAQTEQLFQCKNSEIAQPVIDSFVESFIKAQAEQCLDIEYVSHGNYKVSSSKSGQPKLALHVQDCSANATRSIYINCKTKNYLISGITEIKADMQARLLVMPFQTTYNCQADWPKTSARGESFYLESYGLPSERRVRVNQCYLGSYSHKNNYALDLRIHENEPVKSIKPGVVVKVNDGSFYYCRSQLIRGSYYFKIYDKKTHISIYLKKCPTNNCGTWNFPDVCRTDKGVNQVIVQHPDNTLSQYMHLKGNNTDVQFGDVIDQGVTLGKIGWNGWMTAPHLHMAVYKMFEKDSTVGLASIPVTFKTTGGSHRACSGNNEGIYLNPL